MNTQIHRKQIVMLILSMALAIVSYWIPLPPESRHTLSNDLPKVAAQSPPVESASFVREPMTTWRFPITARIPQTVVHPDSAITQPDDNARPAKHLLELRDLSNGERNHLNNSRFVPIKDRNHNPEHY